MMMRNNDFEALVQAKTALKTKMVMRPSASVIAHEQEPPDDDFDDRFAPSRATSRYIQE